MRSKILTLVYGPLPYRSTEENSPSGTLLTLHLTFYAVWCIVITTSRCISEISWFSYKITLFEGSKMYEPFFFFSLKLDGLKVPLIVYGFTRWIILRVYLFIQSFFRSHKFSILRVAKPYCEYLIVMELAMLNW